MPPEIDLTLALASGRGDGALTATLASLAAWPARAAEGCEVLVMVRGGDDKALARAQLAARDLAMPSAVLGQPAASLTAARQAALERARGRVAFFSLPGCLLPTGLPARLRERFADPDLAALFGRREAGPGEQGWPRDTVLAADYRAAGALEKGWPAAEPAAAAYRVTDLLAAGGFPAASASGGAADLVTARWLLGQGRAVEHDPDLVVTDTQPAGLGQLMREEMDRGRSMYDARRLTGDFAPHQLNQALQTAVVLAATGLAAFLGPTAPANALTLAAACLLLEYPLNRGYLRRVVEVEPGRLSRALALTWLRPWAWAAGALHGAFDRLGPG